MTPAPTSGTAAEPLPITPAAAFPGAPEQRSGIAGSAYEQLRLLTLLAEASEVLSTSVDAELAVGLLAAHVVPQLADWCVISVVDDITGDRRDIGAAHRDPGLLPVITSHARLTMAPGSPMATVVNTAQPLVITAADVEALASLVPDPDARALLGPVAGAVYPLRGRGGSFGAIALINGAGRGAHTAAELDIAKLMARRAGLSMDNARLYSRQQRIAEVLQRSMLSEPPSVPGLDLAFRYLPAATDTKVGGDWYDAFRLPDGSVTLVIGEVVGHDLRAVTIMGQIRTMTRSIGHDRNAEPADLLTRVDAALHGLGIQGLCTALIVRVGAPATDGSSLDITWSSAGHPAPLLIYRGGRVTELDTTPGLLLGTGFPADRTQQSATLAPGTTLLLMTDGLFERRTTGYDLSLDRLRADLIPLSDFPVDELCDAIIAHAATDQPEDDIAIIAVRSGLIS
ncbi:MAG: putative sensor protein [Pseudonocardiales bacterium]|nr:putative sensor protein [Pseudonocardiales bacterium]